MVDGRCGALACVKTMKKKTIDGLNFGSCFVRDD